jgi:hypothetical protein
VNSPVWLRWILVAAFLAVAGYCVVRLVAARRVPVGYRGCHRALDVAHLLMGVGMAVMCSPVGGPVPAAGWQTIFLLIVAWFAGSAWHQWRTGARTDPIGWHGGALHHVIAALAMLYMLRADAHHLAAPWMAGHHAPGLPVLGWVFAAYFLGFAVLLLLRSGTPSGQGMPAVLRSSRVAVGCQLVMALGTGYLLIPILN